MTKEKANSYLLKRLDFAVAIDLYITSTHEFFPAGSVVLPECTMLERTCAMTPDGLAPVVNLQQKAVNPLHQSKPAYWIFVSLAQKMSELFGVNSDTGYFAKSASAADYVPETTINIATGYDAPKHGRGRLHKHDPSKDVEYTRMTLDGQRQPNNAILNWNDLVASGGFYPANWASGYPTVNNLGSSGADDYRRPGSNTRDVPNNAKFRFSYAGNETNADVIAYRQLWENSGVTSWSAPTVPQWKAPAALSTQYPLRFMGGGKVMWHTMGATANLPYLVQDFDGDAQVRTTNFLLINPSDASARGIVNGTWVVVASAVGRVRVQALVTERIQQGFVSIFSGYGQKAPTMKTANNRGVNPNRLISFRYDCGSCQDTSNEEPVQVFKA